MGSGGAGSCYSSPQTWVQPPRTYRLLKEITDSPKLSTATCTSFPNTRRILFFFFKKSGLFICLKAHRKLFPDPCPRAALFYYTFRLKDLVFFFNDLQSSWAKMFHAFSSPSRQYIQLTKLQNYLTHWDKKTTYYPLDSKLKTPPQFSRLWER